jgi:PAS domain-containing protein
MRSLDRYGLLPRGSGFIALVCAIAGVLVLCDFLCGPAVRFQPVFVVPVAILAWRYGRAALILSVVLAVARTVLEVLAWHRGLGLSVLVINALLNLVALTMIASIVARLAREARLLTDRWVRTIECLPVGVLTADAHGRVHYANDMARRIGSELTRPSLTGWRDASAMLIGEADLHGALAHGVQTLNQEVELPSGTGELRVLRTSTSPVTDRGGEVTGAVMIYEDITDRKVFEREREELNHSLSRALAEVKVLRGLLPMCASCGKVRDPEGHWERIDRYLAEHSEIEVSHSICGDCAHELYPDFVARSDDDERH